MANSVDPGETAHRAVSPGSTLFAQTLSQHFEYLREAKKKKKKRKKKKKKKNLIFFFLQVQIVTNITFLKSKQIFLNVSLLPNICF